LDVATELFSNGGFEAVSTREIAAAAKTTLPSIPHYFGSKEGLYEAVLASIAEELSHRLATASKQAIEVAAKRNATRAQRIEAIERLLETHARVQLEGKQIWSRLILQEQLRPTPAWAVIEKVLVGRVLDPIVQLMMSLSHISEAEAKLKTLSLMGRIVIFRLGRVGVLKLMGWDDFTPARIDKILEILKPEIRASLSI
jgi:AcrR family transcriptional regulator